MVSVKAILGFVLSAVLAFQGNYCLAQEAAGGNLMVSGAMQATRRIRQGESGRRYTNVPIIAMTAHAMKGDKELCLEAGMNDYLAKPVKSEELSKLIAQWTR